MTSHYWPPTIGCQLGADRLRLTAYYWLPAIGRLLLTVCDWPPATCRLFLASMTVRLLLTAYGWAPTCGPRPLLAAHCWPQWLPTLYCPASTGPADRIRLAFHSCRATPDRLRSTAHYPPRTAAFSCPCTVDRLVLAAYHSASICGLCPIVSTLLTDVWLEPVSCSCHGRNGYGAAFAQARASARAWTRALAARVWRLSGAQLRAFRRHSCGRARWCARAWMVIVRSASGARAGRLRALLCAGACAHWCMDVCRRAFGRVWVGTNSGGAGRSLRERAQAPRARAGARVAVPHVLRAREDTGVSVEVCSPDGEWSPGETVEAARPGRRCRTLRVRLAGGARSRARPHPPSAPPTCLRLVAGQRPGHLDGRSGGRAVGAGVVMRSG